MPLLPKVARAALHFWEEPPISYKNGSGTVFFSGCSLGCIYCQNYDISHNGYGKTISFERLAEIFYELEQKGAHNINLVNPTHYVYAIKKALDIYRPLIPIVYNTSSYDRVETLKSLEKYIDIYLCDFKYLSADKSKIYSMAEDYPEIAQSAILECYRQKKELIFDNGVLKQGLILRHLILPQATREAIAVFDWYKNNTPEALFSMMSQYTPCGTAIDTAPLNRKITKREYEKVLNYISDFDNGRIFIQDRQSSSDEFIPDFNLEGI